MSDVLVSKTGGKVFHENYCPYALRTEKKNRKFIPEEEAEAKGLRECHFCRSVKGLVYKYRKNGFNASYDPIDNAVCIKTEAGFWKAIWVDEEQNWKLFHLNHGDFNIKTPAKKMMRMRFHRQKDVPQTTSLAKIVFYIRKHDDNVIRYEGNYHKMPRTTPKQQKYYKHAKNRAKKKSIRNVYKILNQIKMEGESKHGRSNQSLCAQYQEADDR